MPKTWSLRTLSNLEEQINLCILNLHFVIPLTWHFTWFWSKCPCLFSGSLCQKISMFLWRLYGQKCPIVFWSQHEKIIKGWWTLDFSLNFKFSSPPFSACSSWNPWVFWGTTSSATRYFPSCYLNRLEDAESLNHCCRAGISTWTLLCDFVRKIAHGRIIFVLTLTSTFKGVPITPCKGFWIHTL